MPRELLIFVGVYGACAVLHVVLNYISNGAWSRLTTDLFPKGD